MLKVGGETMFLVGGRYCGGEWYGEEKGKYQSETK